MDRLFPGWRESVCRPIIMASCMDCVLGQVYGSYYAAPEWKETLAHRFELGAGMRRSEWEAQSAEIWMEIVRNGREIRVAVAAKQCRDELLDAMADASGSSSENEKKTLFAIPQLARV